MKKLNCGSSVTNKLKEKLSATSVTYNKARSKREEKGSITSYELIWERCLQEFHPEAIRLSWSNKDRGMAKLILKRLPAGFESKTFLEAVIEHWVPIVSGIFKQYPNTPQLPFLLRFLSNFTEFYTSLTTDGVLPQPPSKIKANKELNTTERMELNALRKRFKNTKVATKKRKKLNKLNIHVANVSKVDNEFGEYDD